MATLLKLAGYPLGTSWLPSWNKLSTLLEPAGYPLETSWLPSWSQMATLLELAGYPLGASWPPSWNRAATLLESAGYPLGTSIRLPSLNQFCTILVPIGSTPSWNQLAIPLEVGYLFKNQQAAFLELIDWLLGITWLPSPG